MPKLRLLICAGYWGLLTVLLLTGDPAAAIGLDEGPEIPGGDVGAHFLAFAILAFLVHTSRWPRSVTRTPLAVLLLYAVAVESLQWFSPPRTVELKDYANNLLGVAAGTGLYWFVNRVSRRTRRRCDVPRATLSCRTGGTGNSTEQTNRMAAMSAPQGTAAY